MGEAEQTAAHQRSHALEAALRTPAAQTPEQVLQAAERYLQFLQQGPQVAP